MDNFKFEIEDKLKNQIEQLKTLDFIVVDNITLKILNYYKSELEKQNQTLSQLKAYKEREVDAFSIGDSISDGICLVDNKGVVLAINKGYTIITDIDEKEIVGKKIKDGFYCDVVVNMVIKQKKKVSTLSTISSNGKKVLITGTPFFDDKGNITQIFTVMRDLTEIIKLKDKIEKTEKKNEKYLTELKYFRDKYVNSVNLIGESAKLNEIKELINYVAKTDATILITGETGSGKEIVAKEIHEKSIRKDFPYLKVNCAAIPETLIESELFGYEKGAFTGAQNKEKLGVFETANGGTILLDEIGEMPLNMQSKLLRVLQEREVTRLGGTKCIKLDVRVIASTNQDLMELVEKGKFREDLFYRLNVVPIEIPPLRERKGDIMLLAYNFLEKNNSKYTKEKSFDKRSIEALESYNWPGNVRELQNIIERLVVVDDDKYITHDDVIKILGRNNNFDYIKNKSLKEAVYSLEKKMIEDALRDYKSTYKAAKALGVSQPTVFRKATAFGIKLESSD